MATRPARARRTSEKASPASNGRAPKGRATRKAPQNQPAPPPEGQQIDGVIVRAIDAGEGGVKFVAAPVGNVRPTEIPTYLELGLLNFRKDNGLGGS